MLVSKRQEMLLDAINNSQGMTIAELMDVMGTSESTVRRDIKQLHKEGKLMRVFGGAIPVNNDDVSANEEISMRKKQKMSKAEKEKIAEYAASLIRPGDYVYLDAGTTTGYMCKFIKEKEATYVTNAVYHAQELCKKGLKVILIGGELKTTTEALVGPDAIVNLQKYHFTASFFGTNGVGASSGFTTPDSREAAIKRTAIDNTKAGRRYVLADNDKFGKICNVTFSDGEGVILITDREVDQTYNKIFKIQVADV